MDNDTPILTRRGFLFALGAVALSAAPLSKAIAAAEPLIAKYEPARALDVMIFRTPGSGIMSDGLLVCRRGFNIMDWGGALAVGRYQEFETVAQGLAALAHPILEQDPARVPPSPPWPAQVKGGRVTEIDGQRYPMALHVYEFKRHAAEIKALLTPEQVAYLQPFMQGGRR
jgi:hypothetical protein